MKVWVLAAAALLALVVVGLWLFGLPGSVDAAPEPMAAAASNSQPAERPDPAGSVILDEVKQKFIWDAEHVTFKIEHYVGKPFTQALRNRDADGMRAMLRDGFQGSVPGGRAVERKVGGLVERRREGRLQTLDAEAFVARLQAAVKPVRTFEGARMRVLAIDRAEDSDVWDVDLLLTARGVTASNGRLTYEAKGHGTVAFDELDDIEAGKVLATIEWKHEAVIESPRPLMEEVTAAYGLDGLGLLDNWDLEPSQYRSRRYQPAVADFDNDGWLDMMIASIDGRPRLLRSIEGKRFEDVTARSGLNASEASPVRWAINALTCWIDYDNDSYPDLLLAERLYHNEGGGRFKDVSGQAGMKFDRVPMGCVVLDYDLDGRSDLYVVYHKGFRQQQSVGPRPWVDDSESGAPNHLWRNEGDGRFRNVTDEAGAGAGNGQTFAGVAVYYDDDPYPDLYSANDFGRNVLLRNRGDGTFEDITAQSGTGDFATSMGAAAGDIDNDGTMEIYVANMYSKMGRRIIAHVDENDYPPGIYEQIVGSCAGNRLYRKGDSKQYDEIGYEAGVNEVGWAFASALDDFDGNGLLDVYSTTGYMSFDRGEPDG